LSGISVLSSEGDALGADLSKYAKRLSMLRPSMERLSLGLQNIDDETSSESALATMNLQRNQLVKALDSNSIELGQTRSVLGGLEGRLELEIQKLGEMDSEKERLNIELEQRSRQIEELRTKSQMF